MSEKFKVEKTLLLHDNGKGAPQDEAHFFYTKEHTIHFLVKFKDLNFGKSRVKWVFTGVSTYAGRDIHVAEVESESLIANETTAELKLKKDWPFGEYRARIYVNDELVHQFEYEIIEPRAQLKVHQDVSLSIETNNKETTDLVRAFRPFHRKQNFMIQTSGVEPGSKIKWVFYAQDTALGKNQKISEVTYEPKEVSFMLTSFLELPRDWPVGLYRVEVYYNEELLKKFEYKVE